MTKAPAAFKSLRKLISIALAAASILLACPFAHAQSNSAPPTSASGKPLAFSIVSIKRQLNPTEPGREGCEIDSCHFVGRPLLGFIMVAYHLTQKPIVGDPLPGDSDLFDLDAKIDPSDFPSGPATAPLSTRQLEDMLQPVLADRFQLRVHHETRTIPAYNIVLAKSGLKMKESPPSLQPQPTSGSSAAPAVQAPRRCRPTSVGNGVRVMTYCTTDDLKNILEGPSGRYIVDKTGLTGHYDFDLRWTPDATPGDSHTESTSGSAPSLFTAVQEQLGLKLEPTKADVDVLVVDSAKPPSPN